MKRYIVYDPKTGEILKTGICPGNDFELQNKDGEKIIEGIADQKEQYIQNGEIVNRPQMPITINQTTVHADNTDTIIISNIPTGATMIIEREVYTIDDGVAELTFENPGTYRIMIEKFPYKDVTLEVEAI